VRLRRLFVPATLRNLPGFARPFFHWDLSGISSSAIGMPSSILFEREDCNIGYHLHCDMQYRPPGRLVQSDDILAESCPFLSGCGGSISYFSLPCPRLSRAHSFPPLCPWRCGGAEGILSLSSASPVLQRIRQIQSPGPSRPAYGMPGKIESGFYLLPLLQSPHLWLSPQMFPIP